MLVWVTLSEVTRTTMLSFEAAVQDVANITEANRMMGQPDYLLSVWSLATSTRSKSCTWTFSLHFHTSRNPPPSLAMKIVKRTHELPIETTA